MGPAAGVHGGEVVAEGTPANIMASEKSLTGQYLRGDEANPACYPADDLAAWKDRLVALAADGRDVFAFFISGGKPRAPMGAMAMIEALR